MILTILPEWGLAIAGAAMQGILKNPLASPLLRDVFCGIFGASLAIYVKRSYRSI